MELNDMCDYRIEFGTKDEGESYTAYVFCKMKTRLQDSDMGYKLAGIAQEQAKEKGFNLTDVRITVYPLPTPFVIDVEVTLG